MRDDNSPDDTVYRRSLPLQFHRHLKEREVFSAANISLMNLVKSHKTTCQHCTMVNTKLDSNMLLGKENRGDSVSRPLGQLEWSE